MHRYDFDYSSRHFQHPLHGVTAVPLFKELPDFSTLHTITIIFLK
ncbi:MAG: hypothetical protein SWH61_06295 [Thermodesulfobacteriota bacterium]|nr:hypothetical protein [Thermodesulfobacteriota bacterium]